MPKDETKHYRQSSANDVSSSAQSSANDQDPKDGAKPKKVLRACDACHHRRVRCNHNDPCDNCIRLNITCTWLKASKGKQASGRRIDLLRKGHNPAAASQSDPGPSRPVLPTTSSHSIPSISASSPSAARVTLPPPSQSPRHLQPLSSAMTPPGQPLSAGSPGSLYSSRDPMSGPNRTSFSSYTRYDPISTSAPQHPSPSSHWQSPNGRSPGSRYPSHPAYTQSSHSAPSPTSSTSHHYQHPHHPSYSHHSYASHTSPYGQQQPQPQQHHTGSTGSRNNSTSSISGVAAASVPGSGLGFASSESFAAEGLAESFSDLSPAVAAGLRLPDFSTSLADSYLNPQEGSERRRNVLLGLQMGANADAHRVVPPDPHGPGSQLLYNNSEHPTVLDVLGQSGQLTGLASTPGSVSYSESDYPQEPHPLQDSVLIPSIALFFERLQSIMPVFTRSWIFGKIDRGEHRIDPQLGAMLIALSAFALTQPVEASDPVDSSSRKRRVRRLLEESVKMRSSALFGSSPSLEGIMTSFFIFGTLFGLGEENAAWFRLREAVTLGYLLRIHETSSYENLDKDEQERRLRAYLLLAITERAYAIQSGSSITFRGNPRKATDAIRRKFDVSQLQDFPNLQSRLFDVVDEKFVDCWNQRCPGPGCDYLDAKRAVQLHRAIKESDEDEQEEALSFSRDRERRDSGSNERRRSTGPFHPHYNPSGVKQEGANTGARGGGPSSSMFGGPGGWDKAKVQKADVDVTRQWLLNRLWMTCMSHGLLSADAEERPLRIDYSIDIARETLRVCNSLSLRSMEAHGVGLTRKLNDIALTLVIVCRDYPAIAMSVPFEGDPVNTDPTLFGPYLGPSPSSQHSPSASIDSASAGVPTLGMVPFDKAFSPSYAIEAILHKYLDLFKRFRGGDHPYLPQLVEAVKELPKMAELSFDRFLRDMGLF